MAATATAVAHASSECSSSSVAARKFAAVAGKVTRAMAASRAIDFLAEARPWDEYRTAGEPQNSGSMWQHEITRATTVGAAADTQPEAVRVQAAHLYHPYISTPSQRPCACRPSAPLLTLTLALTLIPTATLALTLTLTQTLTLNLNPDPSPMNLALSVQALHTLASRPYISPKSPPYLPRPSAPWRASPISPLYLPRPSAP